MRTWQLQDAKTHLSEVVRLSIQQGPQMLTIRGKEEAVLLSKKDFEHLKEVKPTLFDFMRESPLKGLEIQFERDRSSNRDINL